MRKDRDDDSLINQTLDIFKECIPVFSVLSDENRQKIIIEIAVNDMLNVGQIAERIPLSRPAISHHLKNLKNAGLVAVEKKGTENYYYLTLKESVERLKTLISQIEESCYLK